VPETVTPAAACPLVNITASWCRVKAWRAPRCGAYLTIAHGRGPVCPAGGQTHYRL